MGKEFKVGVCGRIFQKDNVFSCGWQWGVNFPLPRAVKFQSLFLFTLSNVREVNNEYFHWVGKYGKWPGFELVPMEVGTSRGHFALEWDFMQDYYLLVPVTVFDNWQQQPVTLLLNFTYFHVVYNSKRTKNNNTHTHICVCVHTCLYILLYAFISSIVDEDYS